MIKVDKLLTSPCFQLTEKRT